MWAKLLDQLLHSPTHAPLKILIHKVGGKKVSSLYRQLVEQIGQLLASLCLYDIHTKLDCPTYLGI